MRTDHPRAASATDKGIGMAGTRGSNAPHDGAQILLVLDNQNTLGHGAPSMATARTGSSRWKVASWQCAPKARIISGGRIPPGELSIGPEADERLGWVTGWVGAS